MNSEYGQVAYEAYCERVGNRSVHGEQLPAWDDQRTSIQEAWNRAAAAVIEAAS